MEIELTDARHSFENPLDILINGWGRMGIYWGVGKVSAEIHALLYLSPRALNLDEMSGRLKTSRSNISLNVRALQDLGVVRKVIVPGDRKDYYAAETELETVARRLAAAKKKRELDPALDVVTRAMEAALSSEKHPRGPTDPDGPADTARLRHLKDLMEKINRIFETFIDNDMARPGARNAMKP
jgi:DNA-binding transcriptional regulator GbsR (MarR family)